MDRRVLALDGLRGVAALAVFLIHSGGFGFRSFGHWGNALVDHGKYGVTLFFVVSAYSLCLSNDRHGTNWVLFYVRRIFRVMPLFYVVMTVAASVAIVQGAAPSAIARIVMQHVTLISTIDPVTRNALLNVEWSIFVEFTFYALFPLAYWWMRASPTSLLITVLILSFPPTCAWLTAKLGIEQPNFTIFWHLHSFFAGMLAYRWTTFDLEPRPIVGNILFFGAVAVVIWALSYAENGMSITCVTLASVFAIAASHYRGPCASWLNWRPLTFIGLISFSIYLLHPLVMTSVGTFGFLTAAQAAVALALTVLASLATYTFVERPGQKLGRWFAEQISERYQSA